MKTKKFTIKKNVVPLLQIKCYGLMGVYNYIADS